MGIDFTNPTTMEEKLSKQEEGQKIKKQISVTKLALLSQQKRKNMKLKIQQKEVNTLGMEAANF